MQLLNRESHVRILSSAPSPKTRGPGRKPGPRRNGSRYLRLTIWVVLALSLTKLKLKSKPCAKTEAVATADPLWNVRFDAIAVSVYEWEVPSQVAVVDVEVNVSRAKREERPARGRDLTRNGDPFREGETGTE